MLHWLAGQKPPEGQPDINASLYETPETPAPVFAVRAFKHALFGTPQTAQPTNRRHSNTEHTRPRPNASRPERPHLARPKSAGDANALCGGEDFLIPEPAASPTKGILLTPGTGVAKRKTVSFGDGVVDNEARRPVKSGLPDDFPGKFPSPWTAAPIEDTSDDPAPMPRRRSKLTESLEQARKDSAKRKAKVTPREQSPEPGKAAEEEDELPLFDCCRTWKAQYDVYRERSQREIKKLITKHKAAKSFAKDKDFQCTDLADQLRIEKKKVDRLEKRTAELEEQIKAMKAELGQVNQVRPEDRPSSAAARLDEHLDAKPSTVSSTEVPLPTPNASYEPGVIATIASTAVQAASEALGPQLHIDAQPPIDKVRPTRKTEPMKPVVAYDIWNQSFGSSSLAVPGPTEARTQSPKAARPVVSGSSAAPLKTLSVNAIPPAKLTRRDSAQPSPPMDRFAKEPLILQEVIPSTKSEVKAQTMLENPSEELNNRPKTSKPRPTSPVRQKPVVDTIPTLTPASAPVPMPSSPFDTTPLISPVQAREQRPSYFDRQLSLPTQPGISSTEPERPPLASAKPMPTENLKPTAAAREPRSSSFDRQHPLPTQPSASAVEPERPGVTSTKATQMQAENLKPTAAWNAINAPQPGKRLASLTDKQGREVDAARIEAARARMAMRGRALP